MNKEIKVVFRFVIYFIFILMGFCLAWLFDSNEADAAPMTIQITNKNYDVPLKQIDGEWVAEALMYSATATSSATMTVIDKNGFVQYVESPRIYFGQDDEAGGKTFIEIAVPNVVEPVIERNVIRWDNLFTLENGQSAGFKYIFGEWTIKKYLYLSAPAKDCLPSPTSAEFFPGSSESDLIFALGSVFQKQFDPSCNIKVDGIEVNLAGEQVIGKEFLVNYNGAFINRLDVPYAGMIQGQQIYLDELEEQLNIWGWADVKNEAEFDPSYTFQDTTYIDDTFISQAAATTNLDTNAVMLIRPSYDSQGAIGIMTFHLPEIAAAYGIQATTSGSSVLKSFQFKLTSSASAGTVGNLQIGRSSYVIDTADTTNCTWNGCIANPTQYLFTYPAAAWSYVAGTTITLSTDTTASSTLLSWAQKCIAAATDFQIRLNPGWGGTSSDYVQIKTLDNGTTGYYPVLVIEIDFATLGDLVYPGSTFYLSTPRIGAASLTVSASMTNANLPQPFSIILSASGWMEDRSDRVSISSIVNAVSSADASISGASPVYAWYIKPVTYSNLSVTLNNGGASVVYYASNPLDVWTPESVVHKGSTAQVLASTYSLMNGNWMKYYAYDGATKVQCGTSSTTLNTEPNYGIVDVVLPAAQQDNAIHLGVENHMLASVSKTIFKLDHGGGGGSSTDYTERFNHIDGAIEDATGDMGTYYNSTTSDISTVYLDVLANQAKANAIVSNVTPMLYNIQKRTAGNIVPVSGVNSLFISYSFYADNIGEIYVDGFSLSEDTPNMSMTVIKGGSLIKTYNYREAGMGDSITHSVADAKAGSVIADVSVYRHRYTFEILSTSDNGLYNVNGIVSDGTSQWMVGGSFVKSATIIATISDQLTKTYFDEDMVRRDLMMKDIISGQLIHQATNFFADAEIARSLAGKNITDGTQYQYVPANDVYGYSKTIWVHESNGDNVLETHHYLYDYSETTDKRSMILEIGVSPYAWAVSNGYSISWSGGAYAP